LRKEDTMSARNSQRLFRILAVAGLATSAWAGGVRIVERPDVAPFLTIQAAVDAAQPGETLLLGKGTYAAGFSLSAKALSVVGETSGPITINGTVTVQNLASTDTVLLSGLVINGTVQGFGPAPAGLKLSSDAGHVRVEGCTIRGGKYVNSGDNNFAGPAASVTACPQVVFVGCALNGADVNLCSGCPATTGGDGVAAVDSGVTLYDCTLKGGGGSNESTPGGDGGNGYSASSWGLVASGCTFTGGDGGGADYIGCWVGGDGGDGLRIVNAQAHVLDSAMTGGLGANFGFCGPGSPGQALTNQGGVFDQLAGTRRKFTARPIASDDAPLAVTVTGQAGDRVFVMTARKPFYLFIKAFHGTWCVPLPVFLPSVAFAVLPSTAPVNLAVPIPKLHAPDIDKVLFFQVLILDAAGQVYLAGPQHVLLLDNDGGPDCNGNGIDDFVDTALGSEPDANNDFIPDACTASTDHWVDASAPPGGNGSSAMPFQSIQQGINVSLSGYRVIVRDGVYTGPLNTNLSFGGRDIIVKSESGPANCVIDCQGQSRAFNLKAPSTLAARIEGLTIRNGSMPVRGSAIDADAVTVWDCTIENCITVTANPYVSGGAITAGRFDIRRCTFRSNSAGTQPTFSRGGAISMIWPAPFGPSPTIQDCVFVNNHAGQGGAIYAGPDLIGGPAFLVAHCTFLGNDALTAGGAIFTELGDDGAQGLHVDDCLFAGNSAVSYGGALAADRGFPCAVRITNSTFTANSTGGFGGALSFQRSVTASVQNCVLWGDGAASGNEISLRTGSPSAGVASCDVQGGQAGVDWSAGTLTWGPGNLNLDPLFADPDGPDNNVSTLGDNDYSLALASPCIDAGDNNLISADFLDIDGDGNTSEPVPLDLLLHTRRVDVPSAPNTGNGTPPLVDLGAYERP
jgi:predicted outer membrane repeat protein